jgi:hypothetical protein
MSEEEESFSEEGDLSKEEDQPPPERTKRQRTNPFPKDAPFWEDSGGQSLFHTEEALNVALWALARVHFNGAECNSLDWCPKRWEERKYAQDRRRLYYCTLHYSSKCQYRIEVVQHREGHYTIREPVGVEHTNHDRTFQIRGVPKQLKSAVQSPTHLKYQPSQLVRRARASLDY